MSNLDVDKLDFLWTIPAATVLDSHDLSQDFDTLLPHIRKINRAVRDNMTYIATINQVDVPEVRYSVHTGTFSLKANGSAAPITRSFDYGSGKFNTGLFMVDTSTFDNIMCTQVLDPAQRLLMFWFNMFKVSFDRIVSEAEEQDRDFDVHVFECFAADALRVLSKLALVSQPVLFTLAQHQRLLFDNWMHHPIDIDELCTIIDAACMAHGNM